MHISHNNYIVILNFTQWVKQKEEDNFPLLVFQCFISFQIQETCVYVATYCESYCKTVVKLTAECHSKFTGMLISLKNAHWLCIA